MKLLFMRTEELKKFIKENGSLFWYTPEAKGEKVTDELLVERLCGSLFSDKRLFQYG